MLATGAAFMAHFDQCRRRTESGQKSNPSIAISHEIDKSRNARGKAGLLTM